MSLAATSEPAAPVIHPVPRRPSTKQRLYPETAAGGFSRVDGTVAFYTRVNALLRPDMTVLDFGAGRGGQLEDRESPFRAGLVRLRGKVAKVIGADVDPVVRTNPGIDEAIVIEPAADGTFRLPLADASVDLIVSDYTFEHVPNPRATAAELDRVLRPGGWLCARTPNAWGYIGLGNRLIPNRLHTTLLRWMQPGRKEEDVFPTLYRMNSMAALRRLFPEERWSHHGYAIDPEPAYFGERLWAWRLVDVLLRLMPIQMKTVTLAFAIKHHT